jgi:predicted metalloendopeptidase
VIGHEISHSFDNLGADFDSTGRLHNWWTPADLKRFEGAGQALVAQYNAYEALPGSTSTVSRNWARISPMSPDSPPPMKPIALRSGANPPRSSTG